MFCPFQLSEDSIETQFATNHIGRYIIRPDLEEISSALPNSCGTMFCRAFSADKPSPGQNEAHGKSDRDRGSDCELVLNSSCSHL